MQNYMRKHFHVYQINISALIIIEINLLINTMNYQKHLFMLIPMKTMINFVQLIKQMNKERLC